MTAPAKPRAIHYGPGGTWTNNKRVIKVAYGFPVCDSFGDPKKALSCRAPGNVTCKACKKWIDQFHYVENYR